MALNWINSNPAAISAAAAAVSALMAVMVMLASFASFGLNWRLASENRKLRKAETAPRVVAYLALNPLAYGAIDFVIKNIGKGPATEISYRVVSGGADFSAKDVRMLPPTLKYAFLPQDDKLTSSMGMGWELLAEPKLQPFEVEISFEDLTGAKHVGCFRLDVSQFDGIGRLGQPADEQIAEHLRRILAVMEGWSHRRLQVETISVAERQELDRRRRDLMERQRNERTDDA